MTRRGFLIGGLATGGMIAVGGLSIRLGGPAPGAQILTTPELEVVRAVAEVMFPGHPFPLDGVQAQVAERVDQLVNEVMDETRAAAFRYVLRTLEWGTLVSRGRRFTALPREDRREVLENWAAPEVLARRVAGDSLKAVLGMAYFSHPEIISAIGWRVGCGGNS